MKLQHKLLRLTINESDSNNLEITESIDKSWLISLVISFILGIVVGTIIS